MFATAARRMGYVIAVWDPDLEAPAHRITDYSLVRPFAVPTHAQEFTQRVRAVTYEWENVPADLCEQLERDLPVRPSSRVLRSDSGPHRAKDVFAFSRTGGADIFHVVIAG